jgi:hypothetical protein
MARFIELTEVVLGAGGQKRILVSVNHVICVAQGPQGTQVALAGKDQIIVQESYSQVKAALAPRPEEGI